VAARERDKLAGVDHVLTPESISRIPDDALRTAGIISQAGGAEEAAAARRAAIVKLLGAVNTESEFAIVTPGWRERAQFYGDLQRGTVKGEIARSVLQFKSFPWAMFSAAWTRSRTWTARRRRRRWPPGSWPPPRSPAR
jgi:hypothetical protein